MTPRKSNKSRNSFDQKTASVYWFISHQILFLQTDYEGQAKKLMELMENTDLIIIAGGDGTVQEVWLQLCPGLLRIVARLRVRRLSLRNMATTSQ